MPSDQHPKAPAGRQRSSLQTGPEAAPRKPAARRPASNKPASNKPASNNAASNKPTHATRARRPPGRPAGEAPDLRRHLLQIAVRRFARDGIPATSLRDIAGEAGVTPAMLHYYFGGKAALQTAVIEEVLMPVVARLREPLQQAGDDVGGLIAGYVDAVGRVTQSYPWLPQLWAREVLQQDGALRNLLLDRIGPTLVRAMVGRFAEAQKQGRLNPRLDPRLLMISLVGQTMFIAASAPLWRELLDAHDVDGDLLRRHTLELLRNGLELSDAP